MSPFALHSRLEWFVSLLAAAVTSLSIVGSVVYLFVGGGASPAKPRPQHAQAASPAASAPALAGPLEPY